MVSKQHWRVLESREGAHFRELNWIVRCNLERAENQVGHIWHKLTW